MSKQQRKETSPGISSQQRCTTKKKAVITNSLTSRDFACDNEKISSSSFSDKLLTLTRTQNTLLFKMKKKVQGYIAFPQKKKKNKEE